MNRQMMIFACGTALLIAAWVVVALRERQPVLPMPEAPVSQTPAAVRVKAVERKTEPVDNGEVAAASGSFLWTGCNFQRSSAFERYLRSFDPGRIHIGTCVIIGVEQLPVLPEDVFDDAIRIKKEDYTYFVFLCAYYLSKLDMYYLQHFLQSYPPADRWNLDWGSESATNGCYFIYSNFRIATGVELNGDAHGEWRAYRASVYLENAYMQRDNIADTRILCLIENWRKEYLNVVSIARDNALGRGYGLTLPLGVPSEGD